jgi:hypothetical protein
MPQYDFVFIEGVEQEPGNAYMSTTGLKLLDQQVRVIFAKAQLPIRDVSDLIIIPEVTVQTLEQDEVFRAIGEQYKGNKADFYLAKSATGIGVVSAQNIGNALQMRVLSMGIVKKELLFKGQNGLEERFNFYRENIKPIS